MHMLLASTANTWGGVKKGETCQRNTCVSAPTCQSRGSRVHDSNMQNVQALSQVFKQLWAWHSVADAASNSHFFGHTALLAFRQVEDVHIMTGRLSAKKSCRLVLMSALQVEKRPSISFREVL